MQRHSRWDRDRIEGFAKIAPLAVALALLAFPAWGQTNPFTPPGSNSTVVSMGNVAGPVCVKGGMTGDTDGNFQARCEAVAGDSDDAARLNAMDKVSPEQTGSFGTEATRTSGGQLAQIDSAVGGRLAALRAGTASDLQVAFNGQWADLDLARSGAAGDDEGSGFSRLGAFLSGSYQFGDVDSTFEAVGFDFDIGGLTAGVDYRVTDTLVIGGAFSWLSTNSDFHHSTGKGESESFNGSIYGLYYPIDDFYLNGTATVGGIDYEIRRRIRYSVASESVNTETHGDPNGLQYSFAGEAGYDFHFDALTASPYFGADYMRLDVDSYHESGGNGWGMAFRDHNIDSVTTNLGARVSYAISTSFGIVVPQIRSEWVHEYEDDDRTIGARFLGDPDDNRFKIHTEDPDRNYATLGADVSMTLAGGLGAFLSYDTLLGYQHIDSHKFTLGARYEF